MFSQDEYKNKENIGILRCGHEYHADCLRRWLLEKNVCPMCKSIALTPGGKQWDLHVSLFLHAHFLAATFSRTNSCFLLCIWTCTYTQFHCPTQLFVGTTAPEDLCVYQVVQTSVDMLTLGNYILLVFCFSFLCEWLNVPCRSIEWNLFIRIVHLYAFYTVYVCYTSLWSCSRTRIMNKFVDIKQLFSFFQSFHLVRVFFYLF